MSEEQVKYTTDDVTVVPPGYMQNAQGHLVPLANVKVLDQLRDETVRGLIAEAEEMGRRVAEFRASAAAAVAAFVELAAQEHGVELGGAKGNVTMTSYDGTMRVLRSRAQEVTFNEAVSVTRELVFRCIAKWTEGANANLVRLVSRAFETDAQGHLSVAKILGLRQIQIEDDPDWDAAMEALDAAVQVIGSRQYVRFYRRGAEGKYVQVGIDCGGTGEKTAAGNEPPSRQERQAVEPAVPGGPGPAETAGSSFVVLETAVPGGPERQRPDPATSESKSLSGSGLESDNDYDNDTDTEGESRVEG